MKINVEKAVKHAKELMQVGSEQEARVILNDLLLVEPDYIPALLMLGGSYFCEALYDEAETIFRKLVSVAPGLGEASVAYFNALWQQGKRDPALREIGRFTAVADKEKETQTLQDYQTLLQQLDEQS
ncbi:MAG: hypothetical protein KUG82_07625 [Pseudomonadales bacterium]|nr:hypothetical protein [Pseudomonadales bacterium]